MKLCALILINIGSLLDLPSSDWFGDFSPQITIHVIDSNRPQNLHSLFGHQPEAQRILVWDDGNAESLQKQREAYDILSVRLLFCRLSMHLVISFFCSLDWKNELDSDSSSNSDSDRECASSARSSKSESSAESPSGDEDVDKDATSVQIFESITNEGGKQRKRRTHTSVTLTPFDMDIMVLTRRSA